MRTTNPIQLALRRAGPVIVRRRVAFVNEDFIDPMGPGRLVSWRPLWRGEPVRDSRWRRPHHRDEAHPTCKTLEAVGSATTTTPASSLTSGSTLTSTPRISAPPGRSKCYRTVEPEIASIQRDPDNLPLARGLNR